MSIALLHDGRRELARRVSSGLEVTLYWNPNDDSTSVEVWQHSTGETFGFDVPQERALEGFYHPFAHLSTAGDQSLVMKRERPVST